MTSSNFDYGIRIRNIREYQKLSREKLAEMSNISTQFLADIETGKKGMTVVTLHKICNALRISADSIVFGTKSSYSPELEAMMSSIPEEKQKDFEEVVQKIIKII